MAELATKPTDESVQAFLDGIEDAGRRVDCRQVLEIMRSATGEEPCMWGTTMVGFGRYHYRYASGHEGDYFLTGFSPRKRYLTVYLLSGLESHGTLLAELGKHRTGKSCLYLNRLEDVDTTVLTRLVEESVELVRSRYGTAPQDGTRRP